MLRTAHDACDTAESRVMRVISTFSTEMAQIGALRLATCVHAGVYASWCTAGAARASMLHSNQSIDDQICMI